MTSGTDVAAGQGAYPWDETTWPGWRQFLAAVASTGLQLGPACWVAGGAILRAYTGETHADLDVWCSTEEAHAAAFGQLSSLNHDPHPDESQFGSTFWVGPGGAGPRVQLMKRLEPSPTDCIRGFDISVAQLAWDGSRLYAGPSTYPDMYVRRLRFEHCNERPERTLDRLRKYEKRGFRCDRITAESLICAPVGGYEYDG